MRAVAMVERRGRLGGHGVRSSFLACIRLLLVRFSFPKVASWTSKEVENEDVSARCPLSGLPVP